MRYSLYTDKWGLYSMGSQYHDDTVVYHSTRSCNACEKIKIKKFSQKSIKKIRASIYLAAVIYSRVYTCVPACCCIVQTAHKRF